MTNNGFHGEFFSVLPVASDKDAQFQLCCSCCVFEVLAIYIREQTEIRGITINNTEIKIVQFADDTCLYVNGTNSLKNIVKVFEDFYRYAGLRLNIEKNRSNLAC